jgi:PBP1b-binding outer membrane lipoprotein LpoB
MTPAFLKVAGSLLVSALFLTACSKKEEAAEVADPNEAAAEATAAATAASSAPTQTAATPEAETLPGQNAVRSALKSKNYTGAVAQLLAMKSGLPAEMWSAYTDFYGEVRNTLAEASQTDPNAAQALITLRAATAGR